MEDHEARELLGLLYDYVKKYGSESPKTVADLASGLAMSMNVTTDLDDQMRVFIERTLA